MLLGISCHFQARFILLKKNLSIHLRNKKHAKEIGAAGVLPLMFSTMGGALFLFTFYNLTQYTAARSAADQAARRASRCLTPSDAECRNNAASTLSNNGVSQTWYGYQRANGTTTISVDQYTYEGQAFVTKYGASYNSYDVLTVNPILLHQEARIKPQRFLGLLNSYQRLRADITVHVRNSVTNVEKSCRLKEAIELPAIVDFNSPATYYDTRWCDGHTSFQKIAANANNCLDVNNGQWQLNSGPLVNNSYCLLTLPAPRNTGEFPWLQLGGDPVCDGEIEAPFSEIPQTPEDLRRGFELATGTPTLPGSRGRAYPVTATRQFVVVEVYSCNPQAFLNSLRSNIKTKDDLIKHFTSYPEIDAEGFRGNQDFDARGGTSSFVYAGANNVSFLAQQNWTYFEWSRQADGLRHLERKVCSWTTFEEAQLLYPELRDGRAEQYISGSNFAKAVPTITLYDAPSCLNVEKYDVSYNCANRTIFGQPGSFQDCSGWQSATDILEVQYKANAQYAINLNSNQAWANFETLPLNFSWQITPHFSPNYGAPEWQFSWSNSELNGNKITNPSAVKNRNGSNPKILPPSMLVNAFEREDGGIDPTLHERLKLAILNAEGQINDLGLDFQQSKESASLPVEITNVWPFIKESNGLLVPVSRPYVNSLVSGSGFDFDLNCKPDNTCQNATNYTSLDQLLRSYASINISEVDLNDPSYKFSYQEKLVGSKFVTKDEADNFPPCTQFRTLCQPNVGGGDKVNLGSSNIMPESCRNGTYYNCFPEYLSDQVSTIEYRGEGLFELARKKALGEVRRLIPRANLCEDIIQPNCVKVDIQQNGSEIDVGVQFSAPLTTPFKEILGKDTLTVAANKRETIETERLKNN